MSRNGVYLRICGGGYCNNKKKEEEEFHRGWFSLFILVSRETVYSFASLRENYLCKYTINTEISDGVTPLIRDACPSVCGLIRESFSLPSDESERTRE